MKRMNKLLAAGLACVLCVCALALPAFAQGNSAALEESQRSAINAARAQQGNAALTEDSRLAQMAAEMLDVYIAQEQGAVSREEYQQSLTDQLKDLAGIKINDQKVTIYRAYYGTLEGTPSGFTAGQFAGTDTAGSAEPVYIGNAVKTQDGKCYYYIVLFKLSQR